MSHSQKHLKSTIFSFHSLLLDVLEMFCCQGSIENNALVFIGSIWHRHYDRICTFLLQLEWRIGNTITVWTTHIINLTMHCSTPHGARPCAPHPLRSKDVFIHHKIWPSLILIMACHWLGTNQFLNLCWIIVN